ncbi:MAG TPA: cysteine peptidase family C39 domain-containing protein [Vicinamibacteria bacterium]|nr:cysteine peptidase family C39 domain-containing protein [Vicinamibacteria bacterium]
MLALTLLAALPVPYVPQPKDGCGAAALTMVLRYWEQPADVEEIARALVDPELHGIRGSALEGFARERGATAVAYKGDLAQLRDYVTRGRPLIVAWKLTKGYHNVVVVDADPRAVTVHDPAEGPGRRIEADEFERRWRGAGYWTLLVLPKP